MKLKIVFIFIVSMFLFSINEVSAAATVGDSDTSTLCRYDGISVVRTQMINIPFFPQPIFVVPFPGANFTISASKSSDQFDAVANFTYFDDSSIDFDPINDLPKIFGKIDFSDFGPDKIGNVDFIRSFVEKIVEYFVNPFVKTAMSKSIIKNNFTVVVNNDDYDITTKDIVGVDISKSDYRTALVAKGKCPETVAVTLHEGKITGDWNISELTSKSVLATTYDAVWKTYMDFLATFINKNDDDIVIYAALTKERFTKDAKFNSYSSSTCMNQDEVGYYNRQFDIIKSFSANKTYIKFYKNNGFLTIAKDIATRYSENGTCYKQNPSMQSSYLNLANNAQDVVNIFNSTNDKPAKNTCEYLLGDPDDDGSDGDGASVAYYLDVTFRFIKFIAPLLLIALSTFDYIKAISASDADAINKTNRKTIIRLVFALLLFVLPIIISALLTILGIQGDCEFTHIPGI